MIEERPPSEGVGLNEPCSVLGIKQITATGEMLKEFHIDHILCSPLKCAQQSAKIIAKMNTSGITEIEIAASLRDRLGSSESSSASVEIVDQDSTLVQNEPMSSVWNRAGAGWASALSKIQNDNGTVVLVSHATITSAMLCRCLALSSEFVPRINLNHGSVSIVNFPDGPLGGPGIIETCNYTKHLEEGWSVPVYQSGVDSLEASTPLEGF